jgi:hypothetical protein
VGRAGEQVRGVSTLRPGRAAARRLHRMCADFDAVRRRLLASVSLPVPEWRNWQTRGTQNPVRLTPSVGSSPTSGTSFQRVLRCRLSAPPARECPTAPGPGPAFLGKPAPGRSASSIPCPFAAAPSRSVRATTVYCACIASVDPPPPPFGGPARDPRAAPSAGRTWPLPIGPRPTRCSGSGFREGGTNLARWRHTPEEIIGGLRAIEVEQPGSVRTRMRCSAPCRSRHDTNPSTES